MHKSVGQPLYKSKAWRTVRQYVLVRDNFLCVECGQPAEEVHHKKHLNASNLNDDRIALDPDNLICLCRKCHKAEHRNDVKATNKYKFDAEYPYEFDANGYLVAK